MKVLHSLHKNGHWFGYQDFIWVLKTFNPLQTLILYGTRSQILGVKYLNDWKPNVCDFDFPLHKVACIVY